ncbi:type II toxin-antitoxin system RelE/ParE family toxin [Scytonema sp. NUACC26]|uniref:type II toxin-antitoxin system RelE/ParE family toxin n=1 Tax=Scytonema sp. NUACC26 TaxID=3140176 RepID=UPI0034DB9FB1
MRIFKNAWFERFARKERLSDEALYAAVTRASKGLVDADLGGGIIKQRIARQGQGKSGGYRSLIIFRSGDKAFFVYGFAKSERDNIEDDEVDAFKKAAKEMLALSDEQIAELIDKGHLTEVEQDEEISQ